MSPIAWLELRPNDHSSQQRFNTAQRALGAVVSVTSPAFSWYEENASPDLVPVVRILFPSRSAVIGAQTLLAMCTTLNNTVLSHY